jgi:plasmid stabilization system protein ParE
VNTRWSAAAREDLLAAVDHYADAGPDVADQFLDAVDRAVELLGDGLFDGPAVVLTTGDEVRVWSVGVHRLYYRRTEDHLEIVRLFHARRRPIEQR